MILVTVLLTTAVWAALAIRTFTYVSDDIYVFTVVRQSGLSGRLLGLNLFSHFAPVNRFLHWAVLGISPLDTRVGFAVTALLMVSLLVSLVLLLRELDVPWTRQAVAVVATGLSISFLTVGTWWGEGVHILPALIAIILVLWIHVRALRRASWRWHALSIVLLAFGFLTQERALFAPVLVVLVDVFIVWRALPLSVAIRRLWSLRLWLGLMFAVSIAGALIVKHWYYIPEPRAHVVDVVKLFPVSFVRYFVPALLGFNRGSTGLASGLMWLLTALFVVGVGIALRTERSNWRPLAFFAGVYLIFYGFLGVGRLGIPGYTVDLEASDLQYMAYVLPFLLVTVATLQLPRSPLGHGHAAAAGAALALVACLTITGVLFVRNTGGMQTRQRAHDFLATLRSGRSAWDVADVAPIPLRVSSDVVPTWLDPYGREETFLHLVDPDVQVGALDEGARPVFIDASGGTRSVDLRIESGVGLESQSAWLATSGATRSTSDGGCLTVTDPAVDVRINLPSEVSGSPLLLRLAYRASATTSVRFSTLKSSNARTGVINPLASLLQGGTHRALFALDSTDFDEIHLGEMSPGTSLCLSSVDVVKPLVQIDGVCHYVGLYGTIDQATECSHPTSRVNAAQSTRWPPLVRT